jgi:PhnB protein
MTEPAARPVFAEYVSVHAIVADADRAASWYHDVFGAEERTRITLPDGRLIDVQLWLGTSMLVLADEFPEHGALAPSPTASPSVVLYLHVEDVDLVWSRALAADAEVVRPLQDAVWGEREGQITDPFGHRWGLSQHLRDVSAEEKARAVAEIFGA